MTADSDGTVFFPPVALEHDTRYEWKVSVTNSSGTSRTSQTRSFTTAIDPNVNRAPVAASQTLGVQEDGTLNVTLGASDPDGDTLAYSIVNGPTSGTLSGTPPALTYQPTANYSGTDTFTFRANDGEANSNVATVSMTVAAVNDVPVANTNTYTVQGGSTLTVSAPGVLGNDTDVEGTSLTASVATGVSHGTLALATNGSFTYTPAAGYSGPDSFTYRASDGTAPSAPATVSITVQPAPPAPPLTIFTANFNSSENSFSYSDNTFRGTTQSSYASGSRVSSGGFSGGALRVRVGGENSNTINGMSGGWRRTFTLSSARTVMLSFRYNLDQGSEYESDEFSQVMASIDGVLVGNGSADYVAQVTGNGNGGSSVTTGWQLFQKSLGTLSAGTHTVILGGYNNKKNSQSERTTILIDDVTVTAP
jgi:VCBS repeat-containing protein